MLRHLLSPRVEITLPSTYNLLVPCTVSGVLVDQPGAECGKPRPSPLTPSDTSPHLLGIAASALRNQRRRRRGEKNNYYLLFLYIVTDFFVTDLNKEKSDKRTTSSDKEHECRKGLSSYNNWKQS